jgi:protein-disulfide isomerase
MMNQASELFGVSGTPGNVIVDRENGNYILIAGAYPAEEFVNAINEYKNGAENYIAGGDEVKNVVNNMLASTPVRGDENARFTIVEYTELLCPYCQRHSQQ